MKKFFAVLFVMMFVIAQVGFGQFWQPIKHILKSSSYVLPYTNGTVQPIQYEIVIPAKR